MTADNRAIERLAEEIENYLRSVGWANDDLDYDAFARRLAALAQPAEQVSDDAATPEEMVASDRKAGRRLSDYFTWKRAPREALIPEDAGRELEFAWGDAWDLGYAAALTAANVQPLPDDVRRAIEPFAELGRSEAGEQFTDGTIWLLVNGERRFGAINMGDLRQAAALLERYARIGDGR